MCSRETLEEELAQNGLTHQMISERLGYGRNDAKEVGRPMQGDRSDSGLLACDRDSNDAVKIC